MHSPTLSRNPLPSDPFITLKHSLVHKPLLQTIPATERDSFAAPETQGVQQTGLHYPYIGYLSEYLSPESPVILINHFTLTPCPGELLSEVQPCLEIFCPKLKSGFAAHHLREAFAPMTAEWHKGSSRRNHISADALEPEDEGQVIFCVPWQSAEEHEEAATQEYFKQGVANADKLIDSVRLYGHLYPRP